MEFCPHREAILVLNETLDLHSPWQVPHVTLLFGVLISPNLSAASVSPYAERHDLIFLLAVEAFHEVRDVSAVCDPQPRFAVV